MEMSSGHKPQPIFCFSHQSSKLLQQPNQAISLTKRPQKCHHFDSTRSSKQVNIFNLA